MEGVYAIHDTISVHQGKNSYKYIKYNIFWTRKGKRIIQYILNKKEKKDNYDGSLSTNNQHEYDDVDQLSGKNSADYPYHRSKKK